MKIVSLTNVINKKLINQEYANFVLVGLRAIFNIWILLSAEWNQNVNHRARKNEQITKSRVLQALNDDF